MSIKHLFVLPAIGAVICYIEAVFKYYDHRCSAKEIVKCIVSGIVDIAIAIYLYDQLYMAEQNG